MVFYINMKLSNKKTVKQDIIATNIILVFLKARIIAVIKATIAEYIDFVECKIEGKIITDKVT